MILAVKAALNPNTTNQPTNQLYFSYSILKRKPLKGCENSRVFSKELMHVFPPKNTEKEKRFYIKGDILTQSQTSPCFYVSIVQVFWKHCEKRRNCL